MNSWLGVKAASCIITYCFGWAQDNSSGSGSQSLNYSDWLSWWRPIHWIIVQFLHPVGLINSHWFRGLRAKLNSFLEAFCSLESYLNMNCWLQLVLVWTYKMMGNYWVFSPGGFSESHPFLIEMVFMCLLLTVPPAFCMIPDCTCMRKLCIHYWFPICAQFIIFWAY